METGHPPPDPVSTEEKIKAAARKLFTQKGYAATRTRDIAEEAGINLALLNYYFRSKEKLFEQVMMEKVHMLFGRIVPLVSDPSTTLDQKMENIVSVYLDMMTENPNLPLFVLSEIRNHPEHFAKALNPGQLLRESALVKQLAERRPDLNPLQFLFSLLGMTLFPFIAMPVFISANAIHERQFYDMIAQRKTLIPLWMKAILDTDTDLSTSNFLPDPT